MRVKVQGWSDNGRIMWAVYIDGTSDETLEQYHKSNWPEDAAGMRLTKMGPVHDCYIVEEEADDVGQDMLAAILMDGYYFTPDANVPWLKTFNKYGEQYLDKQGKVVYNKG